MRRRTRILLTLCCTGAVFFTGMPAAYADHGVIWGIDDPAGPKTIETNDSVAFEVEVTLAGEPLGGFTQVGMVTDATGKVVASTEYTTDADGRAQFTVEPGVGEPPLTVAVCDDDGCVYGSATISSPAAAPAPTTVAPSTVPTVVAPPSPVATVSQGGDPAPTDGTSSVPWWVLTGGGMAMMLGGGFIFFGPKLRGGSTKTRGGEEEDDDGEDVRDTPVPAIYGEEVDEHACDWEVWFVTEHGPAPAGSLEEEVRRQQEMTEDETAKKRSDFSVDLKKSPGGDRTIRQLRTRVREASKGRACCSAEIRIKTTVHAETPFVHEDQRLIDQKELSGSLPDYHGGHIKGGSERIIEYRRRNAGNGARYTDHDYSDQAVVDHIGLNARVRASTHTSVTRRELHLTDYAEELADTTKGAFDFTPIPAGESRVGATPADYREVPDKSAVFFAVEKALKSKVRKTHQDRQALLAAILREDTQIEITYQISCPNWDAKVQRTRVEYGGQVVQEAKNACNDHSLMSACAHKLDAAAAAKGRVDVHGESSDSVSTTSGVKLGVAKDTHITNKDAWGVVAEAFKSFAAIVQQDAVVIPINPKTDQTEFHNKTAGPELKSLDTASQNIDDRNSVTVTWKACLAASAQAELKDFAKGGAATHQAATAEAATDVYLNIQSNTIKDPKVHNGRPCANQGCQGTTCFCDIGFEIDFPRLSDFTAEKFTGSERPHHELSQRQDYDAMLIVEGKRHYLNRPVEHDPGTTFWTLIG